ncbi:YmdB family metallophosphoesterase [Candidatus Saccharibacteria bacterium CPR2]|nr:YmdB family metallophosphoesterase [Candidatus Saccharibacteria bacterium CPR2]
MNILYIGDIMGKPGREVVARVLPEIKNELIPDVIIAQSENITHGKGIEPKHMHELQNLGVDFFTGGNHSLHRPSIHKYLDDNNQPIIRPANFPKSSPGRGHKIINTAHGEVLVISLLGSTVPGGLSVDHPLDCVDKILEEHEGRHLSATIVNFHGDYSSEKRMIGYYLDGRVTAVIGDHWHVPTADEMILPKRTAHITDVGMCGTIHSSLGVKLDITIKRWQNQIQSKNELEEDGSLQFNAVLVETDNTTHLAKSISTIRRFI